MIDLDELIAEAREWPRDGVNEGRLINALADALEAATRERDAVPDAATDGRLTQAELEDIAETHAFCADRLSIETELVDEIRAERDAAVAALERVRAVLSAWEMVQARNREHIESGNPGMIVPIDCTGGLRAALDGAPEPEGTRWYAACWCDDNGTLHSLESATVVREYAEADVKRWRDEEHREANGQPDRVVLATKIHYPWLPVEGESK